MTPLEKLAVDYVRASDVEREAVRAFAEHVNELGPRTPLDGEAVRLSEARNEAGVKTRTLLAAIRSHVHAAYADELKEVI
jgi:CII-binding regulator of phage lambda lysogenization HflD